MLLNSQLYWLDVDFFNVIRIRFTWILNLDLAKSVPNLSLNIQQKEYGYAMWKTKFLEHSPQNRCPLYILCKIPLAQAKFLLAQVKMHLHWWVGKH